MRAKPVSPVLITTLPRGMTTKHEAQVGDQVSSGRGQVARTPQLESGAESGVESPWVLRLLSPMEAGPRTKSEVARELAKAKPSRHLHEAMARLVASGALGHTIPDMPNSRLQQYRRTPIGRAILASRR
jgi:ATP-dependent DNA helicase RecG